MPVGPVASASRWTSAPAGTAVHAGSIAAARIATVRVRAKELMPQPSSTGVRER